MNPFHDKSPGDLLALVADLADPELDALCAAVCDEFWVEDRKWNRGSRYFGTGQGHAWWPVTSPTVDPREAMRLLVKYRFEVGPWGNLWQVAHELANVRLGLEKPISECPSLCRAITEAAVVCELTRMIEGDGGCRLTTANIRQGNP